MDMLAKKRKEVREKHVALKHASCEDTKLSAKAKLD